MNRRYFIGRLAAGAAGAILLGAAKAQPQTKLRNAVLVHGLYADGSCWAQVRGTDVE